MSDLWPKNRAIYIETAVILLIAIYSLFLQYGSLDSTILLSFHAVIIILGSLVVWFANRFIFERIVQSKIESNKINRHLPLELLAVSVIVTSIIYVAIYMTLIYVENSSFVLTYFLQGFSGTIGLSLLIMMLYLGSQLWSAWWSDGEFLLNVKGDNKTNHESDDYISIKNAKGIVKFDLKEVQYFISESKIVFLVDTSGKKWITQYTLSELENILNDQFFRLNRKIIVSRQAITQVKKLPNHRLFATIGQHDNNHFETISRYKSTRFKLWFDNK